MVMAAVTATMSPIWTMPRTACDQVGRDAVEDVRDGVPLDVLDHVLVAVAVAPALARLDEARVDRLLERAQSLRERERHDRRGRLLLVLLGGDEVLLVSSSSERVRLLSWSSLAPLSLRVPRANAEESRRRSVQSPPPRRPAARSAPVRSAALCAAPEVGPPRQPRRASRMRVACLCWASPPQQRSRESRPAPAGRKPAGPPAAWRRPRCSCCKTACLTARMCSQR